MVRKPPSVSTILTNILSDSAPSEVFVFPRTEKNLMGKYSDDTDNCNITMALPDIKEGEFKRCFQH